MVFSIENDQIPVAYKPKLDNSLGFREKKLDLLLLSPISTSLFWLSVTISKFILFLFKKNSHIGQVKDNCNLKRVKKRMIMTVEIKKRA